MSTLELDPLTRAEHVFHYLQEADALRSKGTASLNRIINDTYIEAGVCMLPRAHKLLRHDPAKSWKRIQGGTEIFRKHVHNLMRKDPASTSKSVHDEFVAAAAESHTEGILDFGMGLVEQHPFLGGVSSHLIQMDSTGDARIHRPFGTWYLHIVEEVANAKAALYRYIQRSISRVPGDELMIKFLQDLHRDVQDYLLACVYTASNFAMHAQDPREDCAVFLSTTSYTLEPRLVSGIQQELDDILELPIYQTYSPSIPHAGVQNRLAHVPTFLSVYDLQEHVSFFTKFLSSLEVAGAKIGVHRTCTVDHDARIRCNSKETGFGNFNIRVDYDKTGKIALDIGSAELVDALHYARELGEQSETHEMIMGYSAIVNALGQLDKIEKTHDLAQHGERHRYTSIMLSSIPDSAKHGLIAAGIISAGKHLVFPRGNSFTYHLSEQLNKPEYKENFSYIAGRASIAMQ